MNFNDIAPVTVETRLPKGPLRVVTINQDFLIENVSRATNGGRTFRPPVTVVTLDADGKVVAVHAAFAVRGGLHLRTSLVDAPYAIHGVDLGQSWLESHAELTLLPASELELLRQQHIDRELAKRIEKQRLRDLAEQAHIAETQRIKDDAEKTRLAQLHADMDKWAALKDAG